jgi:hypothetical protein
MFAVCWFVVLRSAEVRPLFRDFLRVRSDATLGLMIDRSITFDFILDSRASDEYDVMYVYHK